MAAETIFSYVAGGISLLALFSSPVIIYVKFYSPMPRIKFYDELLVDTKRVCENAIRDGLLPTEMAMGARARLQHYEILGDDMRTLVYRCWSPRELLFSYFDFGGQSTKIGYLSREITELRTVILTVSQEERERREIQSDEQDGTTLPCSRHYTDHIVPVNHSRHPPNGPKSEPLSCPAALSSDSGLESIIPTNQEERECEAQDLGRRTKGPVYLSQSGTEQMINPPETHFADQSVHQHEHAGNPSTSPSPCSNVGGHATSHHYSFCICALVQWSLEALTRKSRAQSPSPTLQPQGKRSPPFIRHLDFSSRSSTLVEDASSLVGDNLLKTSSTPPSWWRTFKWIRSDGSCKAMADLEAGRPASRPPGERAEVL
ncbi:hypothetical protein D9615_000862 [Tricholomella constricta]|uniref:Uncharacterized protein n=1 Tax=Tricholomella constricta TaxID=117010 RepID=A0A8H5MBZ7_9AGAR|nr:hypothetical protein D9615_000862 [Tricholomella constricta]